MKDKLAAQEVTSKRAMANMQNEHKAQMDQVNIINYWNQWVKKIYIINHIHFKIINKNFLDFGDHGSSKFSFISKLWIVMNVHWGDNKIVSTFPFLWFNFRVFLLDWLFNTMAREPNQPFYLPIFRDEVDSCFPRNTKWIK